MSDNREVLCADCGMPIDQVDYALGNWKMDRVFDDVVVHLNCPGIVYVPKVYMIDGSTVGD